MWSLGGCCHPLGVPTAVELRRGQPLHGPSTDVSRQGSGDISAQMVGLWKVPGRKSEAESQDFPTPHSPAQLMSPSRFHQHHSRIPVPCLAPTKFLGIK